jgi:hypothetical protein
MTNEGCQKEVGSFLFSFEVRLQPIHLLPDSLSVPTQIYDP